MQHIVKKYLVWALVILILGGGVWMVANSEVLRTKAADLWPD